MSMYSGLASGDGSSSDALTTSLNVNRSTPRPAPLHVREPQNHGPEAVQRALSHPPLHVAIVSNLSSSRSTATAISLSCSIADGTIHTRGHSGTHTQPVVSNSYPKGNPGVKVREKGPWGHTSKQMPSPPLQDALSGPVPPTCTNSPACVPLACPD